MVGASREDDFSVWAESHRVDLIVMFQRLSNQCACRHIPQASCMIPASGRNYPSIPSKGDRFDDSMMHERSKGSLSSGSFPQLALTGRGSSSQIPAIGVIRQAHHCCVMRNGERLLNTSLCLPQPCRAVGAGGQDRFSVGTEGHLKNCP